MRFHPVAGQAALAILVILLLRPPCLLAQTADITPADAAADDLLLSAMAAPSGAAPMSHAMRHMTFTERRPGTPADTARALALVRFLRQAIAPYADPDSARAAGYRPGVDPGLLPRKALVHMGNPRFRPEAAVSFDPARPQALLYRRSVDGTLTLAGAMYTAPAAATLDDLDARVPLSVAQWHKHVDVCLPRAGAARNVALRRADTPEACASAGGRFRHESPRYMVHVLTDVGDDLAAAFPQGEQQNMQMQMAAP